MLQPAIDFLFSIAMNITLSTISAPGRCTQAGTSWSESGLWVHAYSDQLHHQDLGAVVYLPLCVSALAGHTDHHTQLLRARAGSEPARYASKHCVAWEETA